MKRELKTNASYSLLSSPEKTNAQTTGRPTTDDRNSTLIHMGGWMPIPQQLNSFKIHNVRVCKSHTLKVPYRGWRRKYPKITTTTVRSFEPTSEWRKSEWMNKDRSPFASRRFAWLTFMIWPCREVIRDSGDRMNLMLKNLKIPKSKSIVYLLSVLWSNELEIIPTIWKIQKMLKNWRNCKKNRWKILEKSWNVRCSCRKNTFWFYI